MKQKCIKLLACPECKGNLECKIFFKKKEVEDWLLQNRKATTVEIDEMANNHIILK